MFLAFQLGPIAFEHPEIIVASLVGLALLAWLLNAKAIPPLVAMLNDRSSRIEENQNQVQRALDDVQQLRSDYASRLERIEAEARQRIDEAVRESEEARAEIIADAQRSATALTRRAEEEVARERARQRIQFRRQIVQIALGAAEDSVRAHLDEPVQHRLIQDFISRAATDGIIGNGMPAVAAAPQTTRTEAGGETQSGRT